MEARTVGWSIAVAVVATFGFVAMFAIEAEVSTRDLANAQNARSDAQRDLDNTQSSVEKAMERVRQAQKFSTAKDKLNAEMEQIRKDIRTGLEKVDAESKKWSGERDAFERSLTSVRKSVMGSKLEGLAIGGIVHDGVKVMSVSKGVVTMETDTGIQKLPAARLPGDLAEKLKPDWSPELKVTESILPKETPKLAKADDAPPEPSGVARYLQDDVPSAVPSPLPVPAATASARSTKENPVTAELTKHRNAMNALAVNMRAAEQTLADRRSTVARLQAEYNAAKSRGKIVSVPPELAQAQKAVDALLAQFETARKQYAAMVTKLNELTQRETDWYKANP